MNNKTLHEYAEQYQTETGKNPKHTGGNWTIDFVSWFCRLMNSQNKISAKV